MGQRDADTGTVYRVLLAEADHQLLTLLQDQVTLLGHEVLASSRHWEATLNLATTVHADLLLLDLEMPGLDAERLNLLIRSAPDLPVIGLTYADNLLIQPALAAGMRGYLVRSFNIALLRKAMHEAMRPPTSQA